MKSPVRPDDAEAAAKITRRIAELGDWRGATLAHMRQLIHEVDPQIQEEWKWRGVPIWSHDGIVCTGETYKQVVKLTFARGAALKDPKKLFNSSLEGNARRAIDIREGEKINEAAFKELIREAVAANSAARAQPRRKRSRPVHLERTWLRHRIQKTGSWHASRSSTSTFDWRMRTTWKAC